MWRRLVKRERGRKARKGKESTKNFAFWGGGETLRGEGGGEKCIGIIRMTWGIFRLSGDIADFVKGCTCLSWGGKTAGRPIVTCMGWGGGRA